VRLDLFANSRNATRKLAELFPGAHFSPSSLPTLHLATVDVVSISKVVVEEAEQWIRKNSTIVDSKTFDVCEANKRIVSAGLLDRFLFRCKANNKYFDSRFTLKSPSDTKQLLFAIQSKRTDSNKTLSHEEFKNFQKGLDLVRSKHNDFRVIGVIITNRRPFAAFEESLDKCVDTIVVARWKQEKTGFAEFAPSLAHRFDPSFLRVSTSEGEEIKEKEENVEEEEEVEEQQEVGDDDNSPGSRSLRD